MSRTKLPTYSPDRIEALLAWCESADLGASDAEQDRLRRAYEAMASQKIMRQRRANRLNDLCR